MYDLPEPPTASAAGQATPTDADRERIRRLFAAVDEIGAEQPTAVRVDDPAIPSWKDGPRVGTAPPIDQPGRPSMSPRATDASVLMLCAGAGSLMLSGGISLVLWSSGHADPTVVGWMAIAPPAAFLSLKALIKGAKRAATPEIHNHVHNGPEYHETHVDSRKSVWQKTIHNH